MPIEAKDFISGMFKSLGDKIKNRKQDKIEVIKWNNVIHAEHYIKEKINTVLWVVRIGLLNILRKNRNYQKLLKPIQQKNYKLMFLMIGDSNWSYF